MRVPYIAIVLLADISLFTPSLVVASDALWIQPSGNYYGIDGTWSSFGFGVGVPMQHVELTVSTALSEIWVIETGGCSPTTLCYNARGGVFNISASSSWKPLGPWELGLQDLGMGGNGDYGLETIVFTNTMTHMSTGIDSALIAAINDTDYYQGFIGVGVTQSRFGKNVTNPFIPQLAQTYGTIPSHTYGYTAGAHYLNTPASLTLGGYDNLRFEESDVQFHLDQYSRIPSVNLRAIIASVTSSDKQPPNWSSTSKVLAGMNESVSAIIDTTTPYLWLPRSVCDRFAESFNLTWSDTFGVYIFDPKSAQFSDFLSGASSLSFTFSISSYDNVDNYGNPLQLPGVVNITVSSAAFAQLLRYPFKNAIGWDESSVPYFPLKRANEGGPYIVGRAFMQEAYIVMNYETSQFSVNQALFPDNPAANYSLVTIPRSPDSPYPAFVDKTGGKGLSTGVTVGIVVSAFVAGSIIGVVIWCCCRRRRRKTSKLQQPDPVVNDKDDSESVETEEPKSPVKRMFSIIIRRKRSRRPATQGADGSSSQPVEVGADANHEVYELPVPPEPVELDGNNIEDDDATQYGIGVTHGLSAYETARLKLERQLQGPVPTYAPPPPEKTAEDVSPVAHHRPADDPSPASSPTYANSNSLPYSLPSPLTPHSDWAGRHFDIPSPITVVPPSASSQFAGSRSDPGNTYSQRSLGSTHSRRSAQTTPTFSPSSISRSNSSIESPVSPVGSIPPPSPAYQRTPIDPSRIICLGPLPENVQLPHHRPSIPQLMTQDSQMAHAAMGSVSPIQSISPSESLSRPINIRRSTETLGSNYTVEEENRIRDEIARQESMRVQSHECDSPQSPQSPQSTGRIDAGSELVHVPQLAEKRYSWEEDRR